MEAVKYAIWWPFFPEATVGNMLSAYFSFGSQGHVCYQRLGLEKAP